MKTHPLHFLTVSILLTASTVGHAASKSPQVPALRLGDEARPLAYAAELVIAPEESNFTGQITIDLKLERATSLLWLHGRELESLKLKTRCEKVKFCGAEKSNKVGPRLRLARYCARSFWLASQRSSGVSRYQSAHSLSTISSGEIMHQTYSGNPLCSSLID
jgi:hypothetical protein